MPKCDERQMKFIKQPKRDIIFVTKTTLVYGSLVATFSILGIFLPERLYLDNPLTGGLDIEHILGHIVWGLMVGAASLSLRYFLIAGSFAIIIDTDHLIQFLDIEAIGRMGHSISFGLVSVIVLMIIFGKKDYLIGAVALAAMLAHISFDTLTGSGNFPLFVPFYDDMVRFPDSFWFVFLLVGIGLVLSTKIFTRSQKYKKKQLRS